MDVEPSEYHYHTHLAWTKGKKGVLQSQGKPDIEVACPPEFGGHPNIWSPEDLFLASIEVCTMTTFLHYAELTEMHVSSYASQATGSVQMVDNLFTFEKITLEIQIQVATERDKKKVERVFKHIHKSCLTSHSISGTVDYNLTITVG